MCSFMCLLQVSFIRFPLSHSLKSFFNKARDMIYFKRLIQIPRLPDVRAQRETERGGMTSVLSHNLHLECPRLYYKPTSAYYLHRQFCYIEFSHEDFLIDNFA